MTRVLLVHPESALAHRSAAVLRDGGVEVVVVSSGERAIDHFVQDPSDVLVVDLDLPGRDGAATIESIRWAPGGDAAQMILTGTRASADEVRTVARELKAIAVPDGDPLTILSKLELGHTPSRPPTATRELPPLESASGDEAEGRDVEERADRLARLARLDGRLEDVPFPALLARLAEQRASGALVLGSAGDPRSTTTGESPKKVVFFRNGIPVHVRSNLVEECLGQLLQREGLISGDALAESLARVRDGDGRQGGILIAIGALSPQQLRDALQRQQREKLFDVFSWPAGTYAFSESSELPSETVTLEMALAEMVYHGIRERIPSPRVAGMVAEIEHRYAVPGGPGFRGLLRVVDAPERALLEAVDGQSTVAVLIASATRRVEATRVFFAARCLGAIGLREQAESLAEAMPPLVTEAEHVASTIAQGVHGRRRTGMGETFWQFRRYREGDTAASVDWRHSARSAHLFVRETEREAAESIWIWRDGSASMDYASDFAPCTKKDRATVLALALSSLLVQGAKSEA